MVVAVDGTRPAQVAGRRLPRLLRGALVAIGLSGLIWLLGLLIGTGTAAADTAPPDQGPSSQSTGLLGGLVGGLTNVVGGVLQTTTTTVGQLTGGLLDTATSVLPPVMSPPPPAVPETQAPQPEPVPIAKVVARSVPRATVAVERPVRPTPKPAPAPPPAVHKHAVPPVQVAVKRPSGTVDRVDTAGHASPSEPVRTPGKAPSAPAAPALPTGSVTSGHDGHSHARGCSSMLAGQASLEPPAEAFTTRNRATDAGDRPTGLPAASPD